MSKVICSNHSYAFRTTKLIFFLKSSLLDSIFEYLLNEKSHKSLRE